MSDGSVKPHGWVDGAVVGSRLSKISIDGLMVRDTMSHFHHFAENVPDQADVYDKSETTWTKRACAGM